MNKHTKEFAADVITAVGTITGLSGIYWNNAPESKTFPYAVFDVRGVTANRLVIEFDIWSLKGSETALWDIADAIEAQLDGYIVSTANHAGEITSNNDKKWVQDTDERIIRVNMSFLSTYLA